MNFMKFMEQTTYNTGIILDYPNKTNSETR